MEKMMNITLANLDHESIKNMLEIMSDEEIERIIKFSIDIFSFFVVATEALKKEGKREELAKTIGKYFLKNAHTFIHENKFFANVSWELIQNSMIDGVSMSEILSPKKENKV